MKRIPIKPRCKIALLAGAILTLSLISCTRQSSVLEENALQTVVSEESLRNTNVQLTESESEEQTTEEAGTTLTYTYTQPAETIPLATKIQLDKNTLSYGKLQITLPDGVTIEEQKPENDMCVIDLIGAEKSENVPFPPRIWLLHYRAAYQNKWELASILLDILPDTTLRFYDKLGDNLHYLFTYDKLYKKNGYVMVYENDICIVEELSVESGYGFGKLLESDMVHWEDSIQKIDVRNDNTDNADFNKIKAEEDCTLLTMQSVDQNDTRTISLFRDGFFAAPIMKFSFAECPLKIEFEDYNFDGCPDMIVPRTEILLWNTGKKKYEAAQIPWDFPMRSGIITHYPQTQTIWGYDREYVEDANGGSSWDYYDEKDTLWKWEETALVKQRACVAEVRDESVRIWAYEKSPKNMLFDGTFTIEAWEQNSGAVQRRYRQFYAGMVWEESGKYPHKTYYAQEPPDYIPQALLDNIKKAMLNAAVPETLAEFRIDNQLTNDAVLTLAKDHVELRSEVVLAKQYGDYHMDMADLDNDGIMDLIGETYYDGIGNYTQYTFYQGQKGGAYQKTQSRVCVTAAERFDILSYDGKNYLCQTLYNNDEKKDISLSCYVDGTVAETVQLVFFPEKYDICLAECAEDKYRILVENILQNGISYKDKIDEYKNIDGRSEEKAGSQKYDAYQCDLNNDGVLDQYYKDIWARRDLAYLDFFSEDAEIEKVVCDMGQSVEGSAVMMWVEPFAGENIINIISTTEWEDFEITGFLLNGTEYKKLYRITADAVCGVRQERLN